MASSRPYLHLAMRRPKAQPACFICIPDTVPVPPDKGTVCIVSVSLRLSNLWAAVGIRNKSITFLAPIDTVSGRRKRCASRWWWVVDTLMVCHRWLPPHFGRLGRREENGLVRLWVPLAGIKPFLVPGGDFRTAAVCAIEEHRPAFQLHAFPPDIATMRLRRQHIRARRAARQNRRSDPA